MPALCRRGPFLYNGGMSHLIVDERKCRRDGICVESCPAGIIELRDEKAVPTPAERADELCISCGHCVAVCPHGAMSLDVMLPEDCPPLYRDMILSPEQVEHLIRSRRSIRVYREESAADGESAEGGDAGDLRA